jgi:hypothetical protein
MTNQGFKFPDNIKEFTEQNKKITDKTASFK